MSIRVYTYLLAGILREGNNMAVRILRSAGVDARQLYTALMEKVSVASHAQSGGSTSGTENSEEGGKNKTLSEFTHDLTADARTGKLDPVIGRDKEIKRVIQILSRRSKNNPCLIGEPGVGKTAIAEGLAHKIVTGKVPEKLLDKKLLSLDLTGMVAGAKYRGEFEDRIKKVMQEAKKDGNIILFIDELHALSVTQVSNEAGESQTQIQRYIRLTYLVPELQEFVDKGQMKMRPAVELSYLDEETQRDIVDRIDETEAFPSHDQAIRIRKAFEAGEINYDKVQDIMAEEKPNQKPKFKFSFDRLKPYIPKDYNDRMAEDYVIKALEYYQKFLRKQREQAR